jgi:sortase A
VSSKRKLNTGAVILMVVGLVIMAVPFLIRHEDKRRADNYIEQIGVTGNEEVEQEEEQEQTGNGKKKASKEIPEGAVGIIEIPSLDIRYPVFEGAGSEQLNKGIGHLPETADLCEKGNCVLAGHNGSRRGAFFTHLSEIETGAKVMVTNKNQVTHTYAVEDTAIVGPYDAGVRKESDEECLTLFTCAYHGTQRFVCRCRLSDGGDGQTDRGIKQSQQ